MRWNEVKRTHGQAAFNDVKEYLHSRNNMIELNEIHHVMELLADGNAIYVRGAGSKNVIRRNYIHHLLGNTFMQAAIRTDDGQCDTSIIENVIFRCTAKGIVLHLNNECINNFVIDLAEAWHNGRKFPPIYLLLQEGPMTGAVIRRNIFYHPGDTAQFYQDGTNPRLPAAWIRETETDENIYYCAGNPQLAEEVLAATRREGLNGRSVAADPRFRDIEQEDFSFLPDSPALQLGIVAIDCSQAGVLPV